jgi:hypothetical protein
MLLSCSISSLQAVHYKFIGRGHVPQVSIYLNVAASAYAFLAIALKHPKASSKSNENLVHHLDDFPIFLAQYTFLTEA